MSKVKGVKGAGHQLMVEGSESEGLNSSASDGDLKFIDAVDYDKKVKLMKVFDIINEKIFSPKMDSWLSLKVHASEKQKGGHQSQSYNRIKRFHSMVNLKDVQIGLDKTNMKRITSSIRLVENELGDELHLIQEGDIEHSNSNMHKTELSVTPS